MRFLPLFLLITVYAVPVAPVYEEGVESLKKLFEVRYPEPPEEAKRSLFGLLKSYIFKEETNVARIIAEKAVEVASTVGMTEELRKAVEERKGVLGIKIEEEYGKGIRVYRYLEVDRKGYYVAGKVMLLSPLESWGKLRVESTVGYRLLVEDGPEMNTTVGPHFLKGDRMVWLVTSLYTEYTGGGEEEVYTPRVKVVKGCPIEIEPLDVSFLIDRTKVRFRVLLDGEPVRALDIRSNGELSFENGVYTAVARGGVVEVEVRAGECSVRERFLGIMDKLLVLLIAVIVFIIVSVFVIIRRLGHDRVRRVQGKKGGGKGGS